MASSKRQAERSQAFNDIFGRPSAAARPAYNHQQGVRPSAPPAAGSGSVNGPRPQSYYGGQQYSQAYPGAPQHYPQQPATSSSYHGHGGEYGNSNSNVNGYGYGNAYAQQPQQQLSQHAPLAPPPGVALYPSNPHQRVSSYGSQQLPPIPQGAPAPYIPPPSPALSSQYSSTQHMPSPPPAPQGPVFRQLSDGIPPLNKGNLPPLTTNSSIASSVVGGGGGHAPRIPSFDLNNPAEYNWFAGNNKNRSAESTQVSTPSGASGSGNEDISPGLASLASERDQSANDDDANYYNDPPSTSASAWPPSSTANSSRRSYTATTASSSMSAAAGQELETEGLRDSPASGMSTYTGNAGPFADFQQQYPAAYGADPRYGGGPAPYDSRTSLDSDHTSYFIPSTSSMSADVIGGRPYYPSGPSSNTTHNPYQPQSQYQSYPYAGPGQQPPNGGGYPLQGMSSYSNHGHGQMMPGSASLRHTSSRKSAESVRVFPTQPKATSVYGDRSFSFSGGTERPDLRPPSHSPRPGSTISEYPSQPHATSSSGHGPLPSSSHNQAVATRPQRAPIVYPALLSRVADAFKSRITLTERGKDGLSYKDSFDGREAVDKIAYIIRTTDRNLALLLGRALDAQKFFHDVTYDHRLRDSPNELYQFRERLHASPFGSLAQGEAQRMLEMAGFPGQQPQHGISPPFPRPSSPTDTMLSDDSAVPSGVFTLLTDCYSPTCTRDRLCYSIACPRRLEQQARLNIKAKPGLKKSNSEEGLLGDDDRLGSEPGMLWIHTVSKEISDTVDDTEKRRQEAINELIYTERDFVRDMEYLRDKWMAPLRTGTIIPESRREAFVNQVFWNVTDIHAVNIKLAEALTRRQKQQPIVNSIGDILLKVVPDFAPFVKYGAHQLYGKYEFEKEKGSNPAFLKFVETTERLPESRKLELNGYLTKPTTRLARYPLLLEAINKITPEGNPDKENIPKCVKMIRELLGKVNYESGRSEARFNLGQLDGQLVFKPGEAVDLKLRDENRDLIFKGPLKKRGGTQSESAELQLFLFDHAILMVKPKSTNKMEQYKVYRKPIPLELLVVSTQDDPATLRNSTARPKSLMSRTSNTTSKLNISTTNSSSKSATPDPTSKQGFPITFTHLGRKGYNLTLWSPSWAGRKKWLDKIEERQAELRQRSLVFETSLLSEGYFVGTNRVTCAAPFNGGTQMVFGTDNGVYISSLLAKDKVPVKVVSVPNVTQVDVLEDYGILIVLADKAVQTFIVDNLDPSDAVNAGKRARKITTSASFFKTGVCLNRTLVCIVKSGTVSSTIKTLEPIDHHGKGGKKQPTIRKLLQGGNELLRVYKEFYIPTESSSVHFLKSKLCVGCTKGFEIVDLDTLDTQGLLDPADSSLDFVQKRENVRPLAIYRVDGDFLLCYDEFAFYVNKNGWRARSNWLVQWEGNPTSFALHYPYVLAFEKDFLEVRHVNSGSLMQIVPGAAMRLLFADTPPSSSATAAHAAAQHDQHHGFSRSLSSSRSSSMYESPYNTPVRLPGPRRQIIFACDSGIMTLREAA